MSVLCVVQARMGSTRLPGKVLMELDGRPLLRFLLDRIAGIDAHIVVATSDLAIDDPVAECAAAAGVDVVRGSEDDVLARFGRALDRWPADHVVRITADCPLSDPALIAEVIERHLATGADYTSNAVIRTHPDGLDVEVVRAEVLRQAIDEADDPYEREHVMPFVYRRPERFRLEAVTAPEDLGHLRWTVDTADDLAVVRRLAACPSSDWRDLLGLDEAVRLESMWRGEFGDEYVARNSVDHPGRVAFWERTLRAYPATSLLEVGCAHGDNFRYMGSMIDLANTVGADINALSLDTLRAASPDVGAVQCVARFLPFRDRSFDAVVTIGLLIHQPDSTLAHVVADIARCSGRWLMFGEYWANEPTEIEYRGRSGILFKRDYVRIVGDLCPEFRHVATEELTSDADGFDRVTWGVFERR